MQIFNDVMQKLLGQIGTFLPRIEKARTKDVLAQLGMKFYQTRRNWYR